MSTSTKQMSFVADKETLELIAQLKKDLKAPTAAAVLRKALALAKIAAEQAKESDGVVTVSGKGQDPSAAISIALRA